MNRRKRFPGRKCARAPEGLRRGLTSFLVISRQAHDRLEAHELQPTTIPNRGRLFRRRTTRP
jgi:hypothetical protein